MGIIVRQSLKASGIAYFGVALGVINNLFVATHFLTPNELAISRLLLENSLVCAAFAQLSVPFISDRFFTYFKDDSQQHHGFFLFLLLFPLIGISIFVAFYIFLQDFFISYFAKSSELIPYLKLTIPLSIFLVYQAVLEAYCRANARIAIPTFLREAYPRLANMMLILIYGFGWISYHTLMYLIVLSYALAIVCLLFYIKHLGKFYMRLDFSMWTKPLLKEVAIFAPIIILSGLGINMVLFIDRNMLAHLSGTTDVAIFVIASYIASIIEIPRKSITQISVPILAHSIRNNDWVHVNQLYKKSALHQFLAGSLVFLCLVSNIDSILHILPKADSYSQGKWVVIFLSLSKLIDMSFGLSAEMMTYSKYFRTPMYMIVALLIFAFIANQLLIPIYGINGSAMATASTTLLFAILKVSFVKWKFGILPFSKHDLTILALVFILMILGFLIPDFGTDKWVIFVSVAVKSGLLTVLFAICVIKLRVSSEINELYTNFIATYVKRA